MICTNNKPRRAVRTLFIEFIHIDDGWVNFDLWLAKRQMAFHICMPLDHPVIQAFADDNGDLTRLFELQGDAAQFHLDGFSSDGWFEHSYLRRIKKVKVAK